MLASVVACNALNGVGDLTVEDPLAGDLPDATPATVDAPVTPTEGGGPVPEAGVDAPPIATGECTCAPAPPAGWEGPVALGESLGAGPACAVGLVTAYRGGVPPATPPPCTPCACAPAAGARCDTTITLWGTQTCTAGSQCGSTVLSANCQQVTFCNGGSLTSAMRSVLTQVGSCAAPTGGAKGTAAFESEATACALTNAPANACDAGATCAPSPGPETKTCIRQAGDVACPAGPYTEKKTFFEGLADARTCSACSCSGACSGGTTAVYNDTNCTTQFDTTPPNACDSLPANNLNGSAKLIAAASLTCTASGGAVSGTVTGTNPTTFCCLPPM